MDDRVNVMPKHTILLVDDEAAIRDMLSIALEAADYNVLQAENAQQAHASIIDRQPDLSTAGLDDARHHWFGAAAPSKA